MDKQLTPGDLPLEEAAKRAEEWIAQGANIYQKWTCEKCGKRVCASTPNRFTTMGHHDEPDCGYITDMRVKGCGFMLEMSSVR